MEPKKSEKNLKHFSYYVKTICLVLFAIRASIMSSICFTSSTKISKTAL